MSVLKTLLWFLSLKRSMFLARFWLPWESVTELSVCHSALCRYNCPCKISVILGISFINSHLHRNTATNPNFTLLSAKPFWCVPSWYRNMVAVGTEHLECWVIFRWMPLAIALGKWQHQALSIWSIISLVLVITFGLYGWFNAVFINKCWTVCPFCFST